MGIYPLKPKALVLAPDSAALADGLARLRQPVLPLVSMVRFFWETGDFRDIRAIIAQLPAPIETDYCCYQQPRELLNSYLPYLRLFEHPEKHPRIVDEAGVAVDPAQACAALVYQEILQAELEEINSLLCAPWGCTLCCTGPDARMRQEYFEIPLARAECALFPVPAIESPASRRNRAEDEEPLLVDGRPFYQRSEPALFHWQTGWSLILPRQTSCPHLANREGRCRIYPRRPRVCRRPQIFAYFLEPVADRAGTFRLRQSLLAVLDCPYVRALRQEISGYGAASELQVVFSHNKQ